MTEADRNKLAKLLDMIGIDEDGNLHIDGNILVTKDVVICNCDSYDVVYNKVD